MGILKARPESVRIVFTEIEKSDDADGGVLESDRWRRASPRRPALPSSDAFRRARRRARRRVAVQAARRLIPLRAAFRPRQAEGHVAHQRGDRRHADHQGPVGGARLDHRPDRQPGRQETIAATGPLRRNHGGMPSFSGMEIGPMVAATRSIKASVMNDAGAGKINPCPFPVPPRCPSRPSPGRTPRGRPVRGRPRPRSPSARTRRCGESAGSRCACVIPARLPTYGDNHGHPYV